MIGLSKDQIILLHNMIYERYGGDVGILNENMLDSALQTPFQTFGGVDLIPDTKEKIVRLAYGLIKNHAFRDGNKRIGALVLLMLLELNGYHVKATNAEFADIIMGVAASEKDEDDLLKWVDKHLISAFEQRLNAAGIRMRVCEKRTPEEIEKTLEAIYETGVMPDQYEEYQCETFEDLIDFCRDNKVDVVFAEPREDESYLLKAYYLNKCYIYDQGDLHD